MSKKTKIVIASITCTILLATSASASIQPSSILGKALGGNTDGSLIDRMLQSATADNETLALLASAAQDLASGKSLGFSAANKAAGVEIFRKDGGINAQAILNGSQENAYGLKTSSSNSDILSMDTIMSSQAVTASREAIASQSKSNQKLSEDTGTILRDAAETYNEVISNEPRSSLESLDQSNKIAMATGAINSQQVKSMQSLGRSIETSNVLANTAQQQKTTDRIYSDLNSRIQLRESQMARAAIFRPVVVGGGK
jgi:hypothetical protein